MIFRIACNLIIVALLLVNVAELDGARLHLPAVERLERVAYDARMRYFAAGAGYRSDIVIVDIDEKSLSEVGRWPWRRDHLARLTERLFDEYQAAVVGFDILFAESDLRGEEVLAALRRELAGDPAAVAAVRRLGPAFDFDEMFARALSRGTAILGVSFDNSNKQLGTLPPPAPLYDFYDQGQALPENIVASAAARWEKRSGYSGSIPRFLEAAATAGHIVPVFDDDGIIRRVPLFIRYRDGFYPPLAARMLSRLADPENGAPLEVAATDEGGGHYAIDKAMTAQFELPLDTSGAMLINYLGRGGHGGVFPYISAADIYAGRTAQSRVKDKLVLIGSSAPGLNDLRASPINPALPGVEIHATIIANALDFAPLRRPLDAWALETIGMLLLGVMLAFAYPFMGPMLSFPITLALGGALIGLNLWRWGEFNEVYRIVAPLLLLGALFIWNTGMGFIAEWRSKRYLENQFSQYVPPSLARRISRRRGGFMRGESRDLTILFSDVRGFTSISELFSPQELTQLMNMMLTRLSHEIHEQNGTIDKYIGDAVMAFWNAPLDDRDHAAHAVAAAMGMQRAMKKLSAEMEEKGYPELKMGVGINSGPTSVGNMGSKIRLAYTVMGDTVNLASRLEGLTKYYGVPILVGEQTRHKARGFIFREVDCVRVKGRREAVVMFEPLAAAEDAPAKAKNDASLFSEMLLNYRAQNWSEAMQILRGLRLRNPDDGLVTLYIRRIENFIANPPGEDWDGITEFDIK